MQATFNSQSETIQFTDNLLELERTRKKKSVFCKQYKNTSYSILIFNKFCFCCKNLMMVIKIIIVSTLIHNLCCHYYYSILYSFLFLFLFYLFIYAHKLLNSRRKWHTHLFISDGGDIKREFSIFYSIKHDLC